MSEKKEEQREEVDLGDSFTLPANQPEPLRFVKKIDENGVVYYAAPFDWRSPKPRE